MYIYLRTSRYVTAFMRSLGDGQSLLPNQPITFSPYTQEYVVLINGLRLVPAQQQHGASCYSQAAWSNMLNGRLPQGGAVILNRNKEDYLSYAEICTLEKLPNKTKTEAYEFLCIDTPREICLNNRIVRVTKSHTLDSSAANQLRKLMRQAFIRKFLDFETNNITFAKANKIERSSIEIMERFFMEYNIPVSHDQHERDSMRRLVIRWRKEAQQLVKDPVIIGDQNITRIDEHERRGGLPKYD